MQFIFAPFHSAPMSSVEEERCPFSVWCPCSAWPYTSASLWNTPDPSYGHRSIPEDSSGLIRWTVSFMKTWTRSTPATTNTKHSAGISHRSKVHWDVEEGRPERKDAASLTHSEMQRFLWMEITLMIAELLISYQVGTFSLHCGIKVQFLSLEMSKRRKNLRSLSRL